VLAQNNGPLAEEYFVVDRRHEVKDDSGGPKIGAKPLGPIFQKGIKFLRWAANDA